MGCPGWRYAAVVIDLFARRVNGWSMSSHPDTELAAGVMNMVYGIRSKPEGVMFHSDPGQPLYEQEIPADALEMPDKAKLKPTWKLLG